MRNFLSHKWFLFTYLFLVGFSYLTLESWTLDKNPPYQFKYAHDVNQYYSYLPATFIERDMSMSNFKERGYWLVPDKNGVALQKMTMGMSIMYSPFFLVGHGVALVSDYEADGYTKPYSISLKIGTYFYVSIAFYLLYLSLLFFFKPWISAVSISLIYFGTNLFYYTLSEGEMSHSYLFFLFSVVIFNVIQYFENFRLKNLLFLSLSLGLAVLIRPTSIIVVLFPILYGAYKINLLEEIKKNYKRYLLAVFIFFFPIFLQMLYWKIFGGTWMRWSYVGERFYFSSPHLIEFIVGYRKGWLVYTPLMIFSIIGLVFLWKKIPAMRWSIPLILILVVYIMSCWWCWWFGGSYGSRPMVEFYAFLIFPLAAFIEKIAKVKYINYAFIVLFGFLVFYNVLGTHKKSHWELHWDSMTEEAFWFTFSKLELTQDERDHLETLCQPPDYESARKGELEQNSP